MQRLYQLEESLGYVMVCLCKVGWLLVTISSDFYGTLPVRPYSFLVPGACS